MTPLQAPCPGFIVTGTGTNVGKTLVSAMLTRIYDADYWKPLQTGIADAPDDTSEVIRLAEISPSRCHAPAYTFFAARSPLSAALHAQTTIDLQRIKRPQTERSIIVEGAGGLMVPVTSKALFIDIIHALRLPVILVVRTGLGSINHTLLSISALKHYKLPIAGIIMNGTPHIDDESAIRLFGGVRVLGQIPEIEEISARTIDRAARNLALTLPDTTRCTHE